MANCPTHGAQHQVFPLFYYPSCTHAFLHLAFTHPSSTSAPHPCLPIHPASLTQTCTCPSVRPLSLQLSIHPPSLLHADIHLSITHPHSTSESHMHTSTHVSICPASTNPSSSVSAISRHPPIHPCARPSISLHP